MKVMKIDQNTFIKQYNILVDALKKYDISLERFDENGVCHGLACLFLDSSQEGEEGREDFYSIIEFINQLDLNQIHAFAADINHIYNQKYKESRYSQNNRTESNIKIRELINFIKPLSSMSKKRAFSKIRFKTILANWENQSSFVGTIANLKQFFMDEFEFILNISSKYDRKYAYIEYGGHANALIKEYDKYILYDPNNSTRAQYLDSIEAVFNEIINSQVNIGYVRENKPDEPISLLISTLTFSKTHYQAFDEELRAYSDYINNSAAQRQDNNSSSVSAQIYTIILNYFKGIQSRYDAANDIFNLLKYESASNVLSEPECSLEGTISAYLNYMTTHKAELTKNLKNKSTSNNNTESGTTENWYDAKDRLGNAWLMCAARYNETSRVVDLLAAGAVPDIQASIGGTKSTLIDQAIKNNNLLMVKNIENKGIQLGLNQLGLAFQLGCKSIYEYILKSIKMPDNIWQVLLKEKCLLEAEIDFNFICLQIKNMLAENPQLSLYQLTREACNFSSSKLFNLLVQSDLISNKIIQKNNEDQTTPLINAILNRNFSYDDIVRIIELGADINFRLKNGRTALHYAAKANRLDVLYMLIKAGSMVVKDNNGQSVLDYIKTDDLANVVNEIQQFSRYSIEVFKSILKNRLTRSLEADNYYDVAMVTYLMGNSSPLSASEIASLKENKFGHKKTGLLSIFMSNDSSQLEANEHNHVRAFSKFFQMKNPKSQISAIFKILDVSNLVSKSYVESILINTEFANEIYNALLSIQKRFSFEISICKPLYDVILKNPQKSTKICQLFLDGVKQSGYIGTDAIINSYYIQQFKDISHFYLYSCDLTKKLFPDFITFAEENRNQPRQIILQQWIKARMITDNINPLTALEDLKKNRHSSLYACQNLLEPFEVFLDGETIPEELTKDISLNTKNDEFKLNGRG